MRLRRMQAHGHQTITHGAPAPYHRKHNMKHSKYYHYPEVKNAKLNARAEAALDFILAIIIGVCLAMLLVAWWST